MKKPVKKRKFHSVGHSVVRNDAIEKVRGTAKYIDDYVMGNMLYGATVRSTIPHGKIKSIDSAAAAAIKGVFGIFTYKNIPGKNQVPLVMNDYPLLAEDVVKFYGQPIALVAADTLETARLAAKTVKIEYEEYPAVFDPIQALEKDAPKVFCDNNIVKKFNVIRGNAEKALEEADIVVSDTFTTNYQVHAYLEPQGMIAVPHPDGGITVYGSMQCPFYIHDAISTVIGIPHNKVRIVQTTTGGGFGGKEDVPSIVAGHAAVLANILKRPVKIIYTREEDFHSMSKRHPGHTEITYGAKKNGKITAVKIRYILDAGAFSTLSPIVLWRGTVHAAGPYDIPNVFIEGLAVATNKVPCGAFRGFGQPQVTFANESLIDRLAAELKMSPLKLRRINAFKLGSVTATGEKLKESCGLTKVMDSVVKKSGWNKIYINGGKKSGSLKTGVGISISFYGVGLGAGGKYIDRAGSYVQVERDGSALIAIGNTELGQGVFTVVSQITAETLGAPYELMKMMNSDTTRVPDSGPTVASRSTIMSGNAAKNAAAAIRKNIDKMVLKMLCAKSGTVESDGKYYFLSKNPKKKIPYLEAVRQCYAERVNLSSNGWYAGEEVAFSQDTGQGKAYYAYSYSATVAIVDVNTETGEISVKKLVSGHDIGTAINPQQCAAQIQGGAAQSLGFAIMENLVLKNGVIQNPNFAGYLIPTSSDITEIVPVIIEEAYPDGPYGAKGLGEPPMITPATAIANAVYNATGWQPKHLPVLPENLISMKKNGK